MSDWKKVGGDFPPTVEFKKKGDSVEGKLITRVEVSVQKYKSEKTVYRIELDNGNLVSVWGTGQLDYLMKEIKEGTELKIVYLGLQKVKGLRNEVHQWEVFTK